MFTGDHVIELKKAFVDFCDEFSDFSGSCSFLFDAMPCLYTEAAEYELDKNTILGLRKYCGELKEKLEYLEGRLEQLNHMTVING